MPGIVGFVPGEGTGPAPNEELARRLSEWTACSSAYAAIQERYYRRSAELWVAAACARAPGEAAAADSSFPSDRRFAAPEWRDATSDYIRKSYLLYADFLHEVLDATDLEARTKARLRFFLRQFLDAVSPANFIATNPEVVRLALETGGESLARGVRLLIADVEKGRISQTDESAFAVGRNLAATPGDVVYRNDLIEVLRYAPTTERVYARPLLMVPPCINKYYVLDLSPANSFVRHAVAAGHTVLMISWRNPGPELGHLGWADYLHDGVLRAVAVARELTGAERVNMLGFCVGGTLAASALAVLAARGVQAVASLTLLTTLLDFSAAGEIGLMVDEAGVAAREATIGRGGLLDGRDLAAVFSTLRANDLVWPYVVNSYLKGRAPAAFDILYWNADSTHLPGPMYCQYLRNTYLENRLREPGALTMLGEKIDLGKVRLPAYVYASREDHIVPWESAYCSARLLAGDVRFVLGASGHIAGVINPPAGRKRSYWTNSRVDGAASAWLAGAAEHRGSWWPDWTTWIGRFGGEQIAPPVRGRSGFATLGPAPGQYVHQRIA